MADMTDEEFQTAMAEVALALGPPYERKKTMQTLIIKRGRVPGSKRSEKTGQSPAIAVRFPEPQLMSLRTNANKQGISVAEEIRRRVSAGSDNCEGEKDDV